MVERILEDKSFANLEDYHLKTLSSVTPNIAQDSHKIHLVDKNNFPVLKGVTCYQVEIWEECMRLPHWHPNASELGYVATGSIEVFIWRSTGETAVFIATAGMCYFIPQGALHSLNNLGKDHAKLIIGFSNELAQDIDLPVALNGLPLPVRDAYTSPHQDLRNWNGVTQNPLCGKLPIYDKFSGAVSGSPYVFDFNSVTPLFSDKDLGTVAWGVKNNWSIVDGISILKASLKPGIARDAIWYPYAGTLYIVSKGTASFHIIINDHEPTPFEVSYLDYVFVPCGVLHTFINQGTEEFETIAFLSKADPLSEVSLSVATAFFPNRIRRASLTQFANANLMGDPLKHMNFPTQLPYLFRVI